MCRVAMTTPDRTNVTNHVQTYPENKATDILDELNWSFAPAEKENVKSLGYIGRAVDESIRFVSFDFGRFGMSSCSFWI
jgi:hypothetical protein